MWTKNQTGGQSRRLRSLLAVVSGLAAGIFVAPLAAHASNNDGRCDDGEYCMNEDINWSGGFWDEYNNDPTYVGNWYFHTGHSVNDRNSSATNNDRYNWLKQFEHANYSGRYLLFSKHGDSANCPGEPCYYYGWFGWMNDRASSHLFTTTT
jgi:Peptidase inhibitor family I36